jgi:hypothetical protein
MANTKNPKRVATNSASVCEKCGKHFPSKRKKAGGYYLRKYCDVCLPSARAESALRAAGLRGLTPVDLTTKGDHRKRCNHRITSRGIIQQKAKVVYDQSGKPKKCKVCGYSRLYRVAHIRPVSDFPDSALIGEINHIDNLVALCPNHHEEYDKGIMSEKDKKKIIAC